jgi:hypothetical protein
LIVLEFYRKDIFKTRKFHLKFVLIFKKEFINSPWNFNSQYAGGSRTAPAFLDGLPEWQFLLKLFMSETGKKNGCPGMGQPGYVFV